MVKTVEIIIASRNMELIKNIVFLNLLLCINCQKFQDQYPFPPHYQTPSSPILSSDSTIYLPPESSTSMPYFNMNNMKKLPVNYLPPTAVKAPQMYPTPYSPIFSSSRRPDFEDEEINSNNNLNIRRITIPSSQTNKNVTITDKDINPQKLDVRESRNIPAIPNYQQRFMNTEKMESKRPNQNSPGTPPFNMVTQNPASRRMIITSEIQRNDNGLDQIKAASFANSQYLQAPGIFISSTIEPAIPILRLSNEMDLDGSFSYEALGADQTHYVQHSRMENMGTDKEEQVVEGSYSYVGDNGQTYTVHYVADSNGYRASGDHLPVPPPIPEIIQRAVQYNLAEEAKKPPHLRQNWENDGSDFETDNSDHRYAITPLRNLFTGRTPEAFSLGFSQNLQGPLITAASSQIPSKTIYEINRDQNKSMTNIASITPQVTFLASQGAHNPSIPSQQTMSRIVNTEKPILPQIMNYEANNKDAEQEANKALWRWQYGVNPNDNNQNPNKNTISRSSGEGDDIIINFSNMSPEQYTKMLQSQVFDQNVAGPNSLVEKSKDYTNQDKHEYYNGSKDKNSITHSDNHIKNYDMNISSEYEKENNDVSMVSFNDSTYLSQSTVMPQVFSNSQTEENKIYQNIYEPKNDNNQINYNSQIFSDQNYAQSPHTITQSYNFEEDTTYEPVKLNAIDKDILKTQAADNNISENLRKENNYGWFEKYNSNFNVTTKPSLSTFDNIYLPESNQKEMERNDFKPITNAIKHNDYYTTVPAITTTDSIKDVIKDNIFLKNIFKSKNSEKKINNKVNTERMESIHTYSNPETKEDKVTKYSQPQHKAPSEMKFSKKKPLDFNDVLNFVVMKNQFEPAKTKPKSKAELSQEFTQKEPLRYIPTVDVKNEEEFYPKLNNMDYARLKERQAHHDHSVVKNYKVLQRQKHTGQNTDHKFVQDSYSNVKTFHAQNLPPLGRAGPSLKTYLPPTYV